MAGVVVVDVFVGAPVVAGGVAVFSLTFGSLLAGLGAGAAVVLTGSVDLATGAAAVVEDSTGTALAAVVLWDTVVLRCLGLGATFLAWRL